MEHLLEVKNLKTQFGIDGTTVKAVDGVSYYVDEGEVVAFVGESGSGKSVTQYSGLQLIPSPPGKIAGGEIIYEGENLLDFGPRSEKMREIRGGKIGVIFQEPMTSLNPVMTVGNQISEAIMQHLNLKKREAKNRAIELLKTVGIPDAEHRVDYYPHQFSGGMRQRIMIAMTLSCDPKLLIADEATTALDVTTQAQILELMKDVVKRTHTSLVMVTHNLGIVARYADRVYVMYAGEIVESGPTKEIFNNPKHPYTLGLLKAVPRLDSSKDSKLVPIDGMMPDLSNKQDQCAFQPRCNHYTDHCLSSPSPQLKPVDEGQKHLYACYENINKNLFEEKLKKKSSIQEQEEESLYKTELTEEKDTILEVKNLKIYFPVKKGLMKRKIGDVKAVDDVSFKIKKGETLGLVGESGCGKTTVARSILRLYETIDGEISFKGQDIANMSKKDLRFLRKNMSMIFQDPYSSLDPRKTVESIVGEPLKNHKLVKTQKEYQKRISELLSLVGLDPTVKDRVPHEFSGGQRQRIGIARALASDPSIIVCDEAISALDVSIQAQIINLMKELQAKLGLTFLFIAHDLAAVRHISDRIAVMYLGKIVEIGDWRTLYENPQHPYTKALLNAVPIPDPLVEEERDRIIIEGEVPSLLSRPKGCPFSNRCPLASAECLDVEPALKSIETNHEVACIKV
ncbi:ABC transporter ATP-binding protein [Aquibacillus albus]|uniref:Peptide/nickel transport system ATP-binding protein n=1 Tax=Aquibacillus albus TaxID=1168171 RepID=A0ABS2N4J1_9BACI|nr:ABC transporter ATP-binding protein [Aquibacillus albus]MBM7573043.1 peptide/nickel transport system ATP-binding protein [Aquibacillus albus]